MVYVTTEWDYELKTEVFKVNGDKGYAHSTDVIIKEVTHESSSEEQPQRDTSNIEWFIPTFTVDVIRDIGSSNVVFYDNGEPISVYNDGTPMQMINWDISTLEQTIQLHLGYGVEHNIYARYLGNKKGLPSKSATIKLYEEIPYTYSTTIERTTTNKQFPINTPITFPIQFTSGNTLTTAETKTIKLYVNNEYINSTTITLPANTSTVDATITLPNGLTNGLYHIELKFEGDEHNQSASNKFDISVGYQISIIDHSRIFVESPPMQHPTMYYQPSDFNFVQCKLTNYFNEPIQNETISLNYNNLTATTNTNGIATFNNKFDTCKTPIYCEYQGNISESIKIPILSIENIEIEYEPIIAKDYTTNIIATITQATWTYNPDFVSNYSGIPLAFQIGNASDGNASMHYTNPYRQVVIPLVGSGSGVKSFMVYSSETYDRGSYDDVEQYWNVNDKNINMNYYVIGANFYELTTGFKFENINANSFSLIGLGNGLSFDEDWRITYSVVSASKNVKLVTGSWSKNGDSHTIQDLCISQPITLSKGDTITLENSNGTIQIITPNNTGNNSITATNYGYPIVGMTSTTAKSQLTLNNLKFRRL